MHFLKKGQEIWAWVDDPPPLFGQCPKENIFFHWCLPLDNNTFFLHLHPKIIRLVSLPTVNLPPRCHYNINFLRTRPSHRCRLDLLSHHAGCVRSWTTVHLAFFTLLSRIWSGQAPDPRSNQADARTWPYDRWQFYPSCPKVVFKLSQGCLQVASKLPQSCPKVVSKLP